MREKTAQFRARSGRLVKPQKDGSVRFDHGHGYLSRETAMDAEEYFQAKRDAELGRWRDPVMPDRVVSPIGDGAIHVYNEVSREYSVFERPSFGGHAVRTSAGDFGLTDTADRFFDAHPEPKPWQDASQGQIWELDVVGVSNWVAVEAGDSDEPRAVFRDPHTMVTLEVDDPAITAGRRVWPEDAS